MSNHLIDEKSLHVVTHDAIIAARKWVDAQTFHNTGDLYNACVKHFGLTPVIPD